MAHVLRRTRYVRDANADDYNGETVVADHSTNVIARIIGLIGGVIISLLALRFIFMLLGANPTSGIVDFVYTASRPFVAPFFGIFNYQEQFGRSRFELETLIAIVVYGLITWLLMRIVTIGNRHAEV